MIRRACILAFVTGLVLAVGCSYDFNIGSGGVDGGSSGSSGSSGTTPVPDSGKPDTGAATKTGECGFNCACNDGETCRFTCTKPPCSLQCTGDSDCALECAQGAVCAISCKDNSKCDMNCGNGGSQCSFECDDRADCTGACKAGSICDRDCPRDCDIDCAGGLCTGN